MEITTQPLQTLKTLSDRELMEALRESKGKKGFDAIFKQFYDRFKAYVYKGALHCSRNFSDAEELATDITQETFKNILFAKKAFTLPAGATDAECTNRIKAWLGKIANNCFNIEYARYKNIDSLEEEHFLVEDAFDEILDDAGEEQEVEANNECMNKLQEALNSIKNERDKHILREYAREGCIDSGRHLSQGAMDFLCKFYDTTPDNIRQIKKRTLDKIKQICFTN